MASIPEPAPQAPPATFGFPLVLIGTLAVLVVLTLVVCAPNSMTSSDYIQLLAMGTMFVAIILLFVERMKSGRGLGARTIQLTSVFLIVPMILVLALQKILSSETTATLIGALIGYVLSGIGDFRSEGKKNSQSRETIQNEADV